MSSVDSVVVCTRNRPDDVARCLASIAAQRELPPRVVVVDSSEGDATRRVVEHAAAAWPAASRLEHVTSAPALTHQRNVGLAHVGGVEIVHFVDDDVELDSGYVAAVRRAFARDPAVAGIGGFVTNQPPWRVKRFDEWFGLDGRRGGAVLRSGRNVPVRHAPGAPVAVEWLSGAAMSYRRGVLDVEPPDESFPFEGEDVQLSYRVGRHGRLLVVPDARLVHHESGTNRVVGRGQVEAELVARYRRVVADTRLSRPAFWVSAAAQLAKYALTGTLTCSARRLDIARGTWRAMRAVCRLRTRASSAGG